MKEDLKDREDLQDCNEDDDDRYSDTEAEKYKETKITDQTNASSGISRESGR